MSLCLVSLCLVSFCLVSLCHGIFFYRQSGCKTVAICKMCNLCHITHGFVVISKCCTFMSTFTSSTFEK